MWSLVGRGRLAHSVGCEERDQQVQPPRERMVCPSLGEMASDTGWGRERGREGGRGLVGEREVKGKAVKIGESPLINRTGFCNYGRR